MIVVGRLAAHIDHGVDRARAAEQPAARPIHAPALHRRLRRRLVAPVVSRTGELGDAGRHAHKKRSVRAAGLEQQHFGFGFCRQPVGQHRTGRARADDDVIVSRFRHLLPLHYYLCGRRVIAAPKFLLWASASRRGAMQKRRDDRIDQAGMGQRRHMTARGIGKDPCRTGPAQERDDLADRQHLCSDRRPRASREGATVPTRPPAWIRWSRIHSKKFGFSACVNVSRRSAASPPTYRRRPNSRRTFPPLMPLPECPAFLDAVAQGHRFGEPIRLVRIARADRPDWARAAPAW